MEKTDQDFLRQLFKENNELRLKINTIQRELYNKSVQVEVAEDEIRQLKSKLESGEKQTSRPSTQQSVRKTTKTAHDPALGASLGTSTNKELQEAIFALERKNAELKQSREDFSKLQIQFEEQKASHDMTEKELAEYKAELTDLRVFKANTLKEQEQPVAKVEIEVPQDLVFLRSEIEAKDAMINQLKRQTVDIAVDANRKHNDQQNQLQGVEALIEGIRKEYDEFIQITKLETESFRNQQLAEYNELKESFEQHKLAHLEEKKRLMLEYAGLLYSMQSQFEEYRIAAEYMFNTEMSKLEDELSLQSLRYEHEIMYVIQAKDKFYADMMVSKDAKIMSLIEGSDLQSLMQKHELDIENLRKDHAREIERVKSDQESEQKNLIALLQRQNLSLESKCEKLQTHLKSLEVRIRELMGTIESKVKLLNDREEQRLKMENDFELKLADANARISALSQEKEHLRHKVIRLNLNAKGEGENSIENMLKRISRETTDLHGEFEQLSSRYDYLVGENQVLVRRLKEREKFAEFLEREVARRTDEFVAMTRTFEEFLAGRARQARKEKSKRLPHISDSNLDVRERQNSETIAPSISQKSRKSAITRSIIPSKGERSDQNAAPVRETEEKNALRIELERGYSYLRKFKTLSRAFASGDFRIIPVDHYHGPSDAVPGPWQKTPLYGKLDDADLALARMYREPPKEMWDASSKPAVYHVASNPRYTGEGSSVDIKVYEDSSNKGGVISKMDIVSPNEASFKSGQEQLIVGGIRVDKHKM
ncbi:hypothetical protein HDU76_001649 [Blyttiomyces sp. JEL0837]|nr:hypothetical protein HDU76_001649 [Blyttiomyces sp. JEL0837]